MSFLRLSRDVLPAIAGAITFLLSSSGAAQAQTSDMSRTFVEFGRLQFQPEMPELQRFLRANGFVELEAEPLWLINFGTYAYSTEGNKELRFGITAGQLWKARSPDVRNDVQLTWGEFLLGVDVYKYFGPRFPLKPFVGGAGGLYFTSLSINQRQLGTLGGHADGLFGVELDVLPRRAYLMLQGGYRQNIPLRGGRFKAEEVVDIIQTGGPGETIVTQVTDELPVKEQVSGLFYGIRLGVMFGRGWLGP
jgi:hypothetical protein